MRWLRALVDLFFSVVVALALGANPASAAGAPQCDAFTKLSDEAYSNFRKWKCGINLNDDKWKWPPDKDYNYRRFCVGALKDTVDAITQQIQDTISRCRICRARQEQCEAQDDQARKYHCRQPFPGIQACGGDAGVKECMFRYDNNYQYTAQQEEDQEKADLTERNREVDQCIASKKDQIDFCNSYVERTRKAANTAISRQCGLSYQDNRYFPDDAARFDWCISLDPRHSDYNAYDTTGEKAATDLDKAFAGCRGMERLKTPSGALKARTNTGPQPFGNDSQAKSGGAGAGNAKRVGKDSAPNQPGGGGTAMDRLGGVNDNLGGVSGNAGGAQMGRSTSPGTGGAPPASTGGGTNSGAGGGLGAAGRTFVPAAPRIDTPNSPSSIH